MSIKRMRQINKKGFTLVELIVVLVIIGILAAFLVPALTGYIDKAKRNSLKVECRSAVEAAQTLYTESYAAGGGSVQVDDIKRLAEVPGTIDPNIETNGVLAVVHLTYIGKRGDRVVYCKYYDTCAKHEELYNFEDGTGGGGTEEPDSEPEPEPSTTVAPEEGFVIGDYTVRVTGPMQSGSVKPGQIYYFGGEYYYVKDPSWIDNAARPNLTNGNFVKIKNGSLVSYNSSPKPSAGSLAENNGELYIYLSDRGKWQLISSTKN